MSVQQQRRPQIAAMFRGPGPAKYLLPGTCGYTAHDPRKNKKPAFSFGLKVGINTKNTGPGPAYLVPSSMTRRGKDGTPAYTLHDRTSLIQSFQTPAPDTYAPEKQHPPNHVKAPQYSFGLRTPYTRRDPTPAANAYMLPTILGPKAVGKRSLPAFSMTGRSKIGGFHEDLQRTPGPGTYKVCNPNTFKSRKPIYSINGRNYAPGDSTLKPGPGAYSPEKVYVDKKSAPRFTFGVRHSEYIAPLITDPVD
ncbi:outer dense fiber protein 3-like [Actinia tenebrosa]|uniref:Outer dense fiber protein 3-like n=1 Tax=Actinia tenebrosa TaxID=6105 RepID=A0A6P8I1Z6_ACTTE|nr:outer dense fiber protein 3-like [Actinia tenebrosa]